jgi:hypothetical protein
MASVNAALRISERAHLPDRLRPDDLVDAKILLACEVLRYFIQSERRYVLPAPDNAGTPVKIDHARDEIEPLGNPIELSTLRLTPHDAVNCGRSEFYRAASKRTLARD